MKYLRTSQLAGAAGVHPNTIRIYEELGYLSPVSRSPKGYRMFTQLHLEQVLLTRTALKCTWLGGKIRLKAIAVLTHTAAGDLTEAYEQARILLKQIQRERSRAELAVNYLEKWVQATRIYNESAGPVRINDAATALGVTIDMLRNWERNGLIRVPRDPHSGYRLYGPEELGRLTVIRALRQARYNIMSIFRMFQKFDQGEKTNLREVLNSLPPGEEDVFYSTDQWLSKIKIIEKDAGEIILQLEKMRQKK